jgi:GNAT superfamily N-acetyltransferase
LIEIVRTTSENPDFIALVKLLDAELAIRDGADHAFYSQFNKIEALKQVVLAYKDGVPSGCGAIKGYTPNAMEVKRMYVLTESRKSGIATSILSELERWAFELSCERCVLETGKRQPEAIALYTKQGYRLIPNYGQYVGMENSVCYEKNISAMPEK